MEPRAYLTLAHVHRLHWVSDAGVLVVHSVRPEERVRGDGDVWRRGLERRVSGVTFVGVVVVVVGWLVLVVERAIPPPAVLECSFRRLEIERRGGLSLDAHRGGRLGRRRLRAKRRRRRRRRWVSWGRVQGGWRVAPRQLRRPERSEWVEGRGGGVDELDEGDEREGGDAAHRPLRGVRGVS